MHFTSLALKPEELTFGYAKYPLRYGKGLEVGAGRVVPEIKYFPKVGKNLKEEYRNITERVLMRALDLGVEALQLETEFTHVETGQSGLAGEIVSMQKSIVEQYADEYGIRLGLRVTVADIRDFRKPRHDEEAFSKMMETFEEAAANGADVLSIESEGGKELFNHCILRQDIDGIVVSLGLLAALDMEKLWKEIVRIADSKGIIPGGDSACGFANTAMVLATGLFNRTIPHTLAALVRCMSASRSLVAYEMGARGPGKDCAYENVIIKAVTGYPMSMEGKSSAVAHSSLVGNIAAAACDLWSNEQVENVKLFGGYGPDVFLEILHYDTKLMNKAIELGQRDCLARLMVESDKYLDPQAYVLSPDVAWQVADAIVGESDVLARTVEAGLRAAKLIEGEERLRLSKGEQRFLAIALGRLEKLREDPRRVIEEKMEKYEKALKEFRLKDYF